MKYIIAAALSVLSFSSNSPEQFPQAKISNGLIHAQIYLPDNKEGYYRGSRFDWSGVIPDLEYKGHTYFGQWFDKYSPTLHDAIMGPVEAFSPVGYDDAKTGEKFLKIGIGTVTKPEEPKYAFSNPYQIVNAGTWKIKKKADEITFLQTLSDTDYSYEYKKTIQLIKGQPEMVLLHSLKNTGKKVIETDVYNHNFFVMDKQPIGPNFIVKLPFKPTSESDGGIFGTLQDNSIVFLKELENNDHLYYRTVQGFSDSAKDYEIRIENHKTGAAVKITCDQPLSKLVFWSAPKTLCPEPYIRFKINPGETFNWKIFYQFYLCDSL